MTGASYSIIDHRLIKGDGFSFDYIVFNGWPVTAVQVIDASRIIIHHDWPDNVRFEYPPRTFIRRIETLSDADISIRYKVESAVNAHHAAYAFVHNPELYIPTLDSLFKPKETLPPEATQSGRPADWLYRQLSGRADPCQRPAEPQRWDYIEFYQQDFIVSIEPFRYDALGYSGAALVDEIIGSFRFDPQ